VAFDDPLDAGQADAGAGELPDGVERWNGWNSFGT
jgi:hypothetical protein